MNRLKMMAIFGLTALVMTAAANDAVAQRRSGGASSQAPLGFEPYLEFSATYGSMWGGNIDLYYGANSAKIRTGTGGSLGLALAYNIHPMQSVEVSYTRQDGSLDYDYKGLTTLTPMSVNVWHLGSLRTLAPGKIRPFFLASLGVTYFSPSESLVTIDDEDFNVSSATKFSLNFGLGFKSYFGKAERIGIRASFKVMPTLYNTGAGIWFGTGGAGISVGGSAIWQWEAAGGLTIKFGS